MINQEAASHDTDHWGHVGARASCGVLDRMAGGWRGVLGMGYIKLPPRTDKTGSCYQELFMCSCCYPFGARQNDRHFADLISKFISLYEIQQKSYLIKVTPLMRD